MQWIPGNTVAVWGSNTVSSFYCVINFSNAVKSAEVFSYCSSRFNPHRSTQVLEPTTRQRLSDTFQAEWRSRLIDIRPRSSSSSASFSGHPIHRDGSEVMMHRSLAAATAIQFWTPADYTWLIYLYSIAAFDCGRCANIETGLHNCYTDLGWIWPILLKLCGASQHNSAVTHLTSLQITPKEKRQKKTAKLNG